MKRTLLTALLVASLAVPCFAQPGQRSQRMRQGMRGQGSRLGQRRGGFRPTDPTVTAIDKDKDGTISAKELASAAASLKSLDTNNDGKVDRDEIRAAMRSAMMSSMGGRRGGGPGTAGSSTLERAGLKVGMPVPDIAIHDDEGGEFRMADLKGKYFVIVFGCLT